MISKWIKAKMCEFNFHQYDSKIFMVNRSTNKTKIIVECRNCGKIKD